MVAVAAPRLLLSLPEMLPWHNSFPAATPPGLWPSPPAPRNPHPAGAWALGL